MKNKDYRTLLAVAVAVAMTAQTLFTAPVTLYAQETAVEDVQSSARPLKSETVYALISGTGAITDVTVSEQLKNLPKDSNKKINDSSILTNIENVKGDETFSADKDSLTWDAQKKDICYQGTTDKELPLSLEISYRLDGKDITPEELAGKSGHLEMTVHYINHTKGDDYLPFAMITGLILDDETFSNVEIDNGKIISDGDRTLALGLGIPALQSELGLNELNIPDSFTLTADVQNYASMEGITLATNSIFNDIETDKIDSLSDLQDAMGALQSAADQLLEGSGTLRGGLETLLSSTDLLETSVKKLADGSSIIKNGTHDLKDGSSTLKDGLTAASDSVNNRLLPGAAALDDGVGSMQAAVTEQLPLLGAGTSALNTGLAQAADGTASLNAGIQKTADGLSAFKGGFDKTADGLSALSGGIAQAADGAATLSDGVNTASGVAGTLADDASSLCTSLTGIPLPFSGSDVQLPDSQDEAADLLNLKETLSNIPDLPEGTMELLDQTINSLNAEQEQRDAMLSSDYAFLPQLQLLSLKVAAEAKGLNAAFTGLAGQPGLTDGAAALSGALNTGNPEAGIPSLKGACAALDGAMNTGDPENGTPALKDVIAALDSAMSTGDPANGTPSIRDGINALDAALKSGDPATGVPSIRAGIAELDTKINTPGGLQSQITEGVTLLRTGTSQLLEGIGGENGLTDGLSQLKDGAAALNNGAAALSDGSATLDDGLHTLYGKSGEMKEGVTKLADGSVQLNEGLLQFNEEGISQLTSMFSGDVQGLIDRFTSIIDASKTYDNFAGRSDDMEGETKFIFVMNK